MANIKKCVGSLTDMAVFNELKKVIGSNETAINAVAKVFDGTEFTSDFITAFKKDYDIAPSITGNAKQLANAIIKFNNLSKTSVSATSTNTNKDDNKVTTFKYNSFEDRRKGIAHIAGMLLETYKRRVESKTKIIGDPIDYYWYQMREHYTEHCLSLCSELTGKSYKEIKTEFDAIDEYKDKLAYLEKILGTDNIARKYTNSLAMWRELNIPDTKIQTELRKQVFDVPTTAPILNETKSEEDRNDENEADLGSELNGVVEGTDKLATEVTKDDYIGKVTNESGKYSTYMKHASERLRIYFDTLHKTLSVNNENGIYPKFKDDAYGLEEAIGAELALDMLFSSNSAYFDPESMIEYIRTIANNVPGFECFAKLADDCVADQDFAAEIFRTFKKCSMDRVQVVHEHGDSKVKLSTERASRRGAMFFNLLNDAKSNIRNTEVEYNINKINSIRKTITQLQNKKSIKDNDISDLIQEVSTVIRCHFPSIEPKSIETFVHLANNGVDNQKQQLRNIDILAQQLEKIVNKSTKSYNNYLSRRHKINEINRRNARIRDAKQKGTWDGKEDITDITTIYNSDYITSAHKDEIGTLRDLLLPYSVVRTQKDVPNVKGNHFSVVINNSYITELKELLASSRVVMEERNGEYVPVVRNEVLEDWGAEQAKDKQLRYSSILFEQTDDDGEVITPGIFRIVTKKVNGQDVDEVRLTEEGPKLLEIYMLDGSSDMDSGANMTYDEMVMGDFCPTAFIQFFGTEQNKDIKTRIASYFPRIPSDATTMYSIRAPKHDTSNIYVDVDPTYRDTVADEILSNITAISAGDAYAQNIPGETEQEKANNLENVDISDIYRIIKTKYIRVWENNSSLMKIGENTGLINYTDGGSHIYTFVGTLVKEGNEYVMRDAQLMTVAGEDVNVSNGNSLQVAAPTVYDSLHTLFASMLDKDISYYGKDYTKANRVVNRNSKIFKILRNQAKQELMGAAIAVNHYFDTADDGAVLDKGTSDSGMKIIKVKDGRSNTVGYKFYHLDKDGKVLHEEKDEYGVIHYSLGGNAFHSSKFTLTLPNDKGKLAPVNFLDSIIGEGKPIDILYGESNGGNHLHVIKRPIYGADGKIIDQEVIDVDIQPNQQQAIDEAIEKWLTTFLDKAVTNIEANRQFIKGVSVTESNIYDFALNNAIFLMTCDDLLDGDTGFYKNSQTVLKRVKQYEGSGMLYSLIDRIKDTTEPKMSYLNDGEYDDYQRDEKGNLVKGDDGKLIRVKKSIRTIIDASIKDENGNELNPIIGVRAKKSFTGVTVYNTTLTNRETLDPIVDELTKILPGKNKEEKRALAMDIVYGKIEFDKNGNPKPDPNDPSKPKRKGGFSDTTVNDAQSYITIDEWVRRIAGRGQLKRYLPLIKKLIDPNAVLTAADMQEFVQVQKNFYHDKYYDARYGKFVPRQIKNAEFVLVPRFIKGTQLEKVYELMKQAGIDQLNTLETSKAANEEIVRLWDNNGELVGIDSFVADANRCKQEYSYRYLYTQQETPQHMNATNKVGIQISKKIIDNIPEGHPLYDKKIEYMNCLVQNIRDSYDRLLREFGARTDSHGNIIYNRDGSIEGIDLSKLYEKLAQEMRRQGVDENLIEYVTLDENGNPLMPALVNTVLTKFESVYQSIFNNAITKQKLPGFHAAQITNVGWKPMSDNVQEVSYSKKLKYRPVVNGKLTDYIEVMLPASMFGIDRNSEHYKGMSDKDIIKELENDELDIVMGYRIPTEGKQSVCNMKVVGFIDDALGSTIVVPDEWVAQTGSDFDIDSVYGITYETYKDKKGKIHKVQYLDEKSDVDIFDYYSYVNRNKREIDGTSLDRSILDVSDIDSSIEQLESDYGIKEHKTDVNDWRKAEHEAYNIVKEMPAHKKLIEGIVKNNRAISKKYAYAKSIEIYKERLTWQKDKLTKYLDKHKNNPKFAPVAKPVEDLLEATENLLSLISDGTIEAFKHEKDETIKNRLLERQSNIEQIADKLGLLSFDEFKKAIKDKTQQIGVNSRQARNNRILDNMKEMLGAVSSLEENVSRSNFEDIIYWRDELINTDNKVERDNRSAYDPFDQMRYQEDAISGTHLKGISVSLDTWCSVCNTVRPHLSVPIKIVYDEADVVNKGRWTHQDLNDGKVLVTHDKYGWSDDNNNGQGGDRNIVGKLLTVYSSQTTAHILDAVKEGAVPGVNTFTFPAYKTLVNIGSDYKTSISFIMQPGVKRVIDAYSSNNSVFNNDIGNPVQQAIESIAKDLGIQVKPGTQLISLLNTISLKVVNGKTCKEIFNDIFGLTAQEELSISIQGESKIPLLVSKMVERLQDKGFKTQEEKLLFDLGVILTFDNLNKIAGEIQNIARLCNPDKFGAKQNIYETKKVFDDIHKQLWNYKKDGDPKNRTPRKGILVMGTGDDAKHVLTAIYPGCDSEDSNLNNPLAGILKGDISESKYRTLAAYLKYSSALSTILASEVFPTQHPNFVHAVRNFASVINKNVEGLDGATYSDVQKYVLSHYYYTCPSICEPVTYDKDDVRHIKLVEPESDNAIDEQRRRENERIRIFGFGHYSSIATVELIPKVDKDGNKTGEFRAEDKPFTCANIHDPSPKEIEQFRQLSPAQKVEWLKRTLDDPEIFGLYSVSLDNGRERGFRAGTQTIEYIENNLDKNTVFNMFKAAFFNTNPLIKLAAIDLVKYSVMVEGLNMGSTSICKTIPNVVLRGEFGDDSMGLIDHVISKIYDLGQLGNDLSNDKELQLIYEDYLRSHPDTKGVRRLYLSKANKEKFKIDTGGMGAYGTIFIPIEPDKKDGIDLQTTDEFNERMSKAGILKRIDRLGEIDYEPNKYIRIIQGERNLLYKINKVRDGYLLYPLTPLEKNEHGMWSARQMNNEGHPSRVVYDEFVKAYNNSENTTQYGPEFITGIIEELKQQRVWQNNWYKVREIRARNLEAYDLNIQEQVDLPALSRNGEFVTLFNKLQDFWSNPKTDTQFVWAPVLDRYIVSYGPDYASVQTIKLKNGSKKTLIISKLPKEYADDLSNALLKKLNRDTYVVSDAAFEEALKQIPNSQIRQALKQARDLKLDNVGSIYRVVPYVEQSPMYASEEEISSSALDVVEVDMNQGTKIAIETINRLQQSGLRGDTSGVQNDSVALHRELAEYATKKAQELITRFNYFLGNQSILSDDVQEALKTSENEVNRYLQLLNEIKAFLKGFAPYISFDTTSTDSELKFFIDIIKEKVEPVTKLDIDTASRNFAEVYLKSLSTNPLLVHNIINIFGNGYWKSSGAMWRFHDIMENGTPLLQIIAKDIMGNLEAKRVATERDIRNFHNTLSDIEEDAAAHGDTVDRNKLIDENGNLVQNYRHELVTELQNLNNAVKDAIREYGVGSVEHLTAKNKFDIFKATYLNQEAAPEYYLQRAELEYQMLQDMPDFYSVYETARLKRADLFRLARTTGLSEEQEKELAVQNNVIHILTGNTYRIDESILEGVASDNERELANQIVADLAGYISTQANNYNISEAEVWIRMSDTLNLFIDARRNLDDEYFENEPVFGFNELLEKHLKTINDFEQRVNGVPTVPSSVLQNNEQYREAKTWIRENARFELNAKFDQQRQPMNVGAKIVKALNYLGRNSKGRSAELRKKIAQIEEDRGVQIIDEYGNIDASKFTEDELTDIAYILNRTRVTVRPIGNSGFAAEPLSVRKATIHGASDRQLIRSVNANHTIYSPAFYNNISRRAIKGPITAEEAEEIRLHGDPDIRYRDTVKRINEIYLMRFPEGPVYEQDEQGNGIVHLERIPMTQEGVDLLRELANLYTNLKNIENGTELTDEQEAARQNFMDNNVEIDTSSAQSIIPAQLLAIEGKTAPSEQIKQDWEEAWRYVTFDRKANGAFNTDANGELIPNRMLYGVLKPKAEVEEQWIDHEYTEALAILDRYYKRVPSKYYAQASHEAMQRNQTEPGYYNEWYAKNHIFNPETGKVEPLDVWMESSLDYETVQEDDQLANAAIEGYETNMKWVARPSQSRRKVKDGDHNGRYISSDDKRNHDYDPEATLADNYSGYNFAEDRTDTDWNSQVELNDYEKRMRDYIKDTLINSVDLEREKNRYKKGYLPTEAKTTGSVVKRTLKEAGKSVGLVLDKKKDIKATRTEVGFEHDRIPPLPMSEKILWSEEAGSTKFETPEPKLEDYSNLENPQQAFEEAHDNWERAKQENEENNRRVHQAIVNRDFETVIANFLAKQGERRALQDEKHKLYYALNMLQQQKVYDREHDIYGNLKQDEHGYVTTIDQDVVEAWKTFTRRLLNDEYKDSDSGLTRFANRLQQFVSADYMMLNIKGGISNVTLGLTGMLAEAAAGEFVDRNSLGFGIKQWNLGVIGMFRGIYSEKAYNKQDAVVKLFKVVDYDDIMGVSTETDIEKYAERIRNAMFSPQTIGEHYMQNSVLFAMLKSHKIVELDEPIKGLNCTFMNFGDYVNYNNAKLLNEVLTEEQRQQFAEFKADITKDAQELADYAWWKKDFIAQFVAERLSREQREQYIKKRDAKLEQLREEFDTKQDMWSQIELGDDGYASFVPGSKLEELSNQPALDGKVTAADLLVGQFSERVRKVNNKIHGVYNKRGRAYAENKWWGGLFMQYHKHLPTGILKRWRLRGYYNETRGTVEKGMVQSIVSLHKLNVTTLAKDNNWTDDQANTVQSLINILTHSYSYLTNIRHALKLMPEYDRANLRRNLGDLVGVLAGVAGVIALLSLGDDDDEEKIWYALMMYECDRLASEAFLYNPVGLWTETKTLMSTPIAGESIIDDAISAIENIAYAIVGDEDYDGLYHTGQFAGRSKIRVYIERRTPIWNGIRSIRDLPNNNRYFKRGDKVTTIFPTKAIAKKFKGED